MTAGDGPDIPRHAPSPDLLSNQLMGEPYDVQRPYAVAYEVVSFETADGVRLMGFCYEVLATEVETEGPPVVRVTVENTSGVPLALEVTAHGGDGEQAGRLWLDGHSGTQELRLAAGGIRRHPRRRLPLTRTTSGWRFGGARPSSASGDTRRPPQSWRS